MIAVREFLDRYATPAILIAVAVFLINHVFRFPEPVEWALDGFCAIISLIGLIFAITEPARPSRKVGR